MKSTTFHKLALTTALLAAAGFASAQTPVVNGGAMSAGTANGMSSPNRTEVKNEAKMAEREGAGTSTGEAKPGLGTSMAHAPQNGGDVSRAEVKSEAGMAEHSRKGTSVGEASTGTGRDAAHKPTAKHDGTRMQKHAEGKAAAKMPAMGAEKAQ